MTTKDKGDIAEAMVLAVLVEHGYTVLIPWGDNKRYDLAVDFDGKIYRIQCKTAHRTKDGCIRFQTYSVTTKDGKPIRMKYDPSQIDIFMVYWPEEKRVYTVPISDVTSTDPRLRLIPTKNGQSKGVKMASQYEFNGTLR